MPSLQPYLEISAIKRHRLNSKEMQAQRFGNRQIVLAILTKSFFVVGRIKGLHFCLHMNKKNEFQSNIFRLGKNTFILFDQQ